MRLRFILLGIIAVALSASARSEQVTVFAAASLTNAIEDITKEYQQQSPDKIVNSFASSSVLARQIEQGAPADIFISADQQWMDYLANKQLIDAASRKTLLGNHLVVIAPKDSQQANFDINQTTDWAGLLNNERLAIGDPDHVPVGIYAKQAFNKLGAWTSIENKLARADNVRSALLLVERAEVPLGIVYKSDSVVSNKVRIVATFPADTHMPVEYPLAIVADHNKPAVASFYQFLQGNKAKAIFERYGFTTQ